MVDQDPTNVIEISNLEQILREAGLSMSLIDKIANESSFAIRVAQTIKELARMDEQSTKSTYAHRLIQPDARTEVLPISILNILKRRGIKTYGELSLFRETDMGRWGGVGPVVQEQLVKLLSTVDLLPLAPYEGHAKKALSLYTDIRQAAASIIFNYLPLTRPDVVYLDQFRDWTLGQLARYTELSELKISIHFEREVPLFLGYDLLTLKSELDHYGLELASKA